MTNNKKRFMIFMESESDKIEGALKEFEGLWYWWIALDANKIYQRSSELKEFHFTVISEFSVQNM
jgi:hypothetical protein